MCDIVRTCGLTLESIVLKQLFMSKIWILQNCTNCDDTNCNKYHTHEQCRRGAYLPYLGG